YYVPDRVTTNSDAAMRVPAVDAGVAYVNIMGQLWAMEARTGRVLWTWGTFNFGASPATANAVVYFYASSNSRMYALDAAHVTYNSSTGAQIPVLWNIFLPNAVSPIVSDGVLYAGSGDGRFSAVDTATGAFKWRFSAGSGSFTGFQMPAISGDL